MDVTRENFMKLLPRIEEAISECDFVAIDTELSGLRKGKSGNLFDVHGERYSKLKDGCMGYSLIQLGLSCFKKDSENEKFICNSFNFYVFPYKVSKLPKHFDRSFELQPAGIQFLRGHGFDFNFLFDKGINWLTADEEKEVEKIITENLERNDATEMGDKKGFVVPPEQQDFVNNVIQQIEKFIEKGSQDEKLDLAPCSAFQRKMVYESIRASKFFQEIQVRTCTVKDKREQYLSVSRSSKEVRLQGAKDCLTEGAGVSRVIQSLIKHAKPIVGHNFILDVMHIVNQFVCPLPETYADFKKSVHAMFPRIYDTKFIATTMDFKNLISNTTLGDMYETVQKEPFRQITIEQTTLSTDEEKSSNNLHEAGYDSYITGVAFVALNEYLRQRYNCDDAVKDSSPLCSELRRFENMLHLSYTFDFTHLNMGKEDVKLDRKHVFHVSFPSEWRTSNLVQLFSAFGYVTIGWLSGVSALVGLKEAGKWKEVRKSFQKGPASLTYSVITYEEYLDKIKSERVMGSNANSASKRTVTVDEDEQNKRKLQPEEATLTANSSTDTEIKRTKVEALFPENNDW